MQYHDKFIYYQIKILNIIKWVKYYQKFKFTTDCLAKRGLFWATALIKFYAVKTQNWQSLDHFNLTAFQKLLLITLPHQTECYCSTVHALVTRSTRWSSLGHLLELLSQCVVVRTSNTSEKATERKGRGGGRTTKSGKKWQPEKAAKNRKKLGICWKGFFSLEQRYALRPKLSWPGLGDWGDWGDWATRATKKCCQISRRAAITGLQWGVASGRAHKRRR